MFTKCPACGSLNVRRSSIRPDEASGKPRLHSPYRCRDCGERFWVISKRANYLAILAAITIVVATFAWNVAGVRDTQRQESQRPTLNPESFAEVTKRAEHSDPVAEYNLSQMYARGEGVEANKKEAETWLERAAQHGNVNAQYELGNLLREGAGVVQDYAGAAKWLELAALSGYADAQYALGQMYRTGVGVPADNVRAYIWFNLAAAQNVPGATAQRDVLLRALTPAQVLEAQTEARRLSQLQAKSAPATQ